MRLLHLLLPGHVGLIVLQDSAFWNPLIPAGNWKMMPISFGTMLLTYYSLLIPTGIVDEIFDLFFFGYCRFEALRLVYKGPVETEHFFSWKSQVKHFYYRITRRLKYLPSENLSLGGISVDKWIFTAFLNWWKKNKNFTISVWLFDTTVLPIWCLIMEEDGTSTFNKTATVGLD